jgi:DNA-binding Lrp family transcriptional regulator
MSKLMHIDDAARIRVLEAMLSKASVSPNLNQLQRKARLHKATVKASIEFLKREGVLDGFGPKVNFRKFGYGLEVISLLQVDLSEKTVFEQFLQQALNDPHFFDLSSVMGSGNWNLLARHFYKDIESFHRNWEENYAKAIPGLFKLVRDRQTFYVTEPRYKSSSRTFSILEAIKKEKGLV